MNMTWYAASTLTHILTGSNPIWDKTLTYDRLYDVILNHISVGLYVLFLKRNNFIDEIYIHKNS